LQLYIGLLLKVIPFKWIPQLFAGKVKSQKLKVKNITIQVPGIRNQESGTLDLMKTAIQRCEPYSPWKNKCLVQSLAARRMLNRRKISSQLCLGVAKDENCKTIAHAWLKIGDFEIIEKGSNFSELYMF
jgi:hypothetical protein